MGRKKKLFGRIVENQRAKKKDAENEAKQHMKDKEKEITPQEHEERLKALREAGLIK